MVGAGLAWACTPSGFGTPATPGSTPTSTPAPPVADVGGSPAATAPGVAAPVAVGVNTTSPANSAPATRATSGATRAGSHAVASPRTPASTRIPASTRAPASSTAPSSQFAARAHGATAGVARHGSQVVFAQSAAPVVKARGKTKGASRTPAAPARAQVPAQSAIGDLWSGVGTPTSPLSAAEASAGGGSGGLGSGVVLALALLGVGVVGLGAFGATTARRRAASKTTR